MKFKEVIAVNNKLEKVCDRYVTLLNITLKPTKPFYKMRIKISFGAVDGLSRILA
jgi:hypothetical protein